MHGDLKAGQAKRIAVIGTGISGLSAAWLLSKRHHVTVYEKDDRLGGHSNTVDVKVGENTLAVDTGFIVYNDVNYPNLVALLDYLGVETVPTDMSFSVSIGEGTFEYAGSDVWGLIAQRSNLLRPRFFRMVWDIRRFYRDAPGLLSNSDHNTTLGEYLTEQRYSNAFVHDHLMPMGAAIWSTPPDKMLGYPTRSFVRFCQNHGLLSLKGRPAWRTIPGGAREYVRRIRKELPGPVRLGEGVQAIRRHEEAVLVRDGSGVVNLFDDVVIATHADTALRLLADPDRLEQEVLGAFSYQRNRAVLHRDSALMPRRRAAWASWNYLASCEAERHQGLSVSYWMNRLQHLDPHHPLFVTLNPYREPAREKVFAEFDYMHPVFDRATEVAQHELWSLQGQRHTWFCGSYFGWGFHEDGLQAGLAVAEDLGGMKRPWCVENESYRIQRRALRPNVEHVAA